MLLPPDGEFTDDIEFSGDGVYEGMVGYAGLGERYPGCHPIQHVFTDVDTESERCSLCVYASSFISS